MILVVAISGDLLKYLRRLGNFKTTGSNSLVNTPQVVSTAQLKHFGGQLKI